jgi:hypothetical protein
VRPNAVRLCVGAEVGEGAFRTAIETIREVFGQYPHVHDFN